MEPARAENLRPVPRRATLGALLGVLVLLTGLVAMHAMAAFTPAQPGATAIAVPYSGSLPAAATTVGADSGAVPAADPGTSLGGLATLAEACTAFGEAACLLIGTLCALGILAVLLGALLRHPPSRPWVAALWSSGLAADRRFGFALPRLRPSLFALGISRT